jgi:hypothetical protein
MDGLFRMAKPSVHVRGRAPSIAVPGCAIAGQKADFAGISPFMANV